MIKRRLYSCWVIISMALCFLLFIIPLVICAPITKLHKTILWINYVWAWTFFRLALLPVKTTWEFDFIKNQQYILCANHFSYLDIPAMGLFPRPFKFVGKSQLSKIPLFGFMYNKIHITVNRSSYRSRANSLLKARKELSNGFNMGFYPEGGIRLKEFPKMMSFQDGAFRLAVETNTPIIPITFLDNYHIMPDDALFNISRRKCRIVYHKPVYPGGSSDEDMKQLKQEVFRVIQSRLDNDLSK